MRFSTVDTRSEAELRGLKLTQSDGSRAYECECVSVLPCSARKWRCGRQFGLCLPRTGGMRRGQSQAGARCLSSRRRAGHRGEREAQRSKPAEERGATL